MELNLVPALRIDGWMSINEILWLASAASQHKNILEVGSWLGRSTRALADHTSGTVIAVDKWEGVVEPEGNTIYLNQPEFAFERFLENMVGYPEGKVRALKATSKDAFEFLRPDGPQFDMIFIDASHTYEDVKTDITNWKQLVVPGGLLCGHDYSAGWPEVVKAVNETLPDHLLVSDSIWAVILSEGK